MLPIDLQSLFHRFEFFKKQKHGIRSALEAWNLTGTRQGLPLMTPNQALDKFYSISLGTAKARETSVDSGPTIQLLFKYMTRPERQHTTGSNLSRLLHLRTGTLC